MSAIEGVIFARKDYAGFWRRSAALLIDLVVINAAYHGGPWLWYWFAPREWVSQAAYAEIRRAVYLLAFVYLFLPRLTDRGTLGYRILGIRYAPMMPRCDTRLDRTHRMLWAAFLLFGFLLDHIWIAVDQHRQAWHDKLTGYYVIRRGAQPIARVAINRRVINFGGLTFIVFEPAPAV